MRARRQPPVLAQVADGVLRLTEGFIEPRQVEVAVREGRILDDRRLIRLEGRTRATQVFEHDAEIEHQHRVRLHMTQRLAIDVLRLPELAPLMDQPAQVGPGREVRGIDTNRALVGLLCLARIDSLELDAGREPFF